MKRNHFKSAVLGAVLSGLAVATLTAFASDTAEPAFTASANVAIVSNYTFRGVTYTQGKPAVQGGFDLAHSSGAYLGVWGSNVSESPLNGAAGEVDIYGGYASSIGAIGYDVGFLKFIFPGGQIAGTGEKYDTLELYASLSWEFLNIKYSRTLSDYFGFNDESFGLGRGDSKGSHYVEANVAYEFMPGWTFVAHAGHQTVKNYGDFDFSDWRLGLTRDFEGGWQAGVAWVDTDADKALYTICNSGGGACKDTSAGKWVVHLKRSF
jgi:uncharacterized protein (TIGR02001 family)